MMKPAPPWALPPSWTARHPEPPERIRATAERLARLDAEAAAERAAAERRLATMPPRVDLGEDRKRRKGARR